MATDLPGEDIISPKIVYLPFLYSLPGVSSIISNSDFTLIIIHTSASNSRSASEGSIVVLSALLFSICLLCFLTDLLSSPVSLMCTIHKVCTLHFCSVMTQLQRNCVRIHFPVYSCISFCCVFSAAKGKSDRLCLKQ